MLTVIIIIIFAYFIISLITSYILCYLFIKVSTQKDEYLSIFYEIEPNYVIYALDKCEIFNQKMLQVIDNLIENKT